MVLVGVALDRQAKKLQTNPAASVIYSENEGNRFL
jgi:hypothetical protein